MAVSPRNISSVLCPVLLPHSDSRLPVRTCVGTPLLALFYGIWSTMLPGRSRLLTFTFPCLSYFFFLVLFLFLPSLVFLLQMADLSHRLDGGLREGPRLGTFDAARTPQRDDRATSVRLPRSIEGQMDVRSWSLMVYFSFTWKRTLVARCCPVKVGEWPLFWFFSLSSVCVFLFTRDA